MRVGRVFNFLLTELQLKHNTLTRINYINLHVLSSVPTEAWADPQSVSMCGSPLRGGAGCSGRALLRTFCVYYGCGFRSRLCPPWVNEVNKTELHSNSSPAAGINTVLWPVGSLIKNSQFFVLPSLSSQDRQERTPYIQISRGRHQMVLRVVVYRNY